MIATLHGIVVSSMGGLRNIVTSNLVLHYNTFNTSSYNGSGDTISDLTGNGFNGSVTGAPSWSTNYFSFSNDYITTPDLAVPLTEVHSVELWVYPTGNGVLTQANTQSTPNINYHHTCIEIVSGKLEFGLWNGTGITSTGATDVISLNEWHQVVLTYDGTTVRGYLDGQFSGSVNVTWDSPEDSTGNFFLNFGYRDITNQGDGTDFDGRFGIMRVYSVALSPSQVNQNYIANTNNISALVTDQLSLYYDPENSASYSGAGTSIYNLSPNTLTGTASNLTYTSPYFSFNGTSSQVQIADNALLEAGASSFSVEAWVRFDNFTTSSVIVGKFDNGGRASDVSYGLRANTEGDLRFEVGDGVTSVSVSGVFPTTGVWYQIVGVFDQPNDELRLYSNGTLVSTQVCAFASLLNTANALYLGSYNNGEYDQYLDGDLGVVRIYKKALSTSEVQSNYSVNRSTY